MAKRTIHSKYLFENLKMPENYYPPIIIADSIKTPENLGNIIRLGDNIKCRKVLFLDSEPNIRISKIKKTASSSFKSIDWEFCSINELNDKIPEEYSLVAIETTSDSDNIFTCSLPLKIAFVVGNEVSGIRNSLLDSCNQIVHIPVLGNNSSLNVSHALAIAMFEWQRKSIFG